MPTLVVTGKRRPDIAGARARPFRDRRTEPGARDELHQPRHEFGSGRAPPLRVLGEGDRENLPPLRSVELHLHETRRVNGIGVN